MSDCLYGKLNSETIVEKYTSLPTETAKTSISNKNVIEVNVVKTPKKLTIVKNSDSGNSVEYVFDGSENINIDLHEVDVYSGKSTNETASVIVDKEENSIDVQVLKTPGTLTITKGEEELGQFNGSENLSIAIPEYTGSSNNTSETIVNNSSIEVNVKALPTDDSYITGQEIKDNLSGLEFNVSNISSELSSTQSALQDLSGNVENLSEQLVSVEENLSNAEEDITQLETTTSILTTTGVGDKYLSDDGQYKEISGFELSDLPQFTNKLYINMGNYGATNLNGVLTIPIVESSNFSVDWGDNSALSIYTNATTSITHTYSDPAFQGWVKIYGDWKGIKFTSSSNDNKRAIIHIEYDANISSIPDYGLYGAAIQTLTLPFNFTGFGKYCLYSSSLYEFKQPVNSHFLSNAFESCSNIEKVSIYLNGNAGAPEYAFRYNYTLSSLECEENNFGSTTVYKGMFYSCYQLRYVKLPSNIGTIKADAFYNCQVMNKLEIDGTGGLTIESRGLYNVTDLTIHKPQVAVLNSINGIALGSTTSLKIVRVPYSLLLDYKTASNWSTYADKIYPIGGQYSEIVTIPADSWVDNSQTVQVAGSTSEQRNVIEFSLVDSNGKQIEDIYGLSATQGTAQMTFTCQTKPTQDIQVFIKSTLTNY